MPDYCECIFKILKCKIVPKITSERIVGGKLVIDGTADIKIFYVGEEKYHIRCINQRQSFCKSVDLDDNYDNGTVTAFVKCNYVNCRAVNQQRIDIRGTVGIKATVSIEKNVNVLSNAEGMGLQTCTKKLTTLDKKLSASKEFTVEEELELGYGKPEIGEILDYSAVSETTDCKIIANKAIAKGEISLHLLYCSSEDKTPEVMESTIAISQVIDISGITDDYSCSVIFDVIDASFELKQNNEGECRIICSEICIRAVASANRNTCASLINDAYSTCYELQTITEKVETQKLIDCICENHICKNTITIPQGELNCVYDISCDFINESCRIDNGAIIVTGSLCTSVLAMDCENMPVLLEKSTFCEVELNVKPESENVIFSPSVSIVSVSYALTSEKEVEARAEIRVCGNLFKTVCFNAISGIEIDETCKKECDRSAALRLYFANEGEEIWEIAKRFNTSIEFIIEENNLSSNIVTEKCMLLIPIVG